MSVLLKATNLKNVRQRVKALKCLSRVIPRYQHAKNNIMVNFKTEQQYSEYEILSSSLQECLYEMCIRRSLDTSNLVRETVLSLLISTPAAELYMTSSLEVALDRAKVFSTLGYVLKNVRSRPSPLRILASLFVKSRYNCSPKFIGIVSKEISKLKLSYSL
jgi:hypothetical protein